MAKSKIIVDIANGTIDTQIALKRAKILLQELNDDNIIAWINHEIEGYPDKTDVPSYRKINGILRGSYFMGSMSNYVKYQNVSLPLGNMPVDMQEALLITNITEGVEALKQTIEDGNQGEHKGLVKNIPADIYPAIVYYNNNPFMNLSSVYVEVNMPQLINIFSKVENKLLDILYYLEKQFGNLDEFDLDTASKDEAELREIVNHIQVIIYNDNSVKVGNDNKIKDSTIAATIESTENN